MFLFRTVYGMETGIKGGKNLEVFISEYIAPTHIHTKHAHMEQSKAFLQMMHRYSTYSSNTDMHHPQQKTAENYIKVHKKGTNTTLENTGSAIYVWLNDLFLWVIIYNFMPNLPMDTDMIMQFFLSPSLTSAIVFTTNYETIFTNMIQSKSYLSPRSNTDSGLVLHNI